MLKGANKLDHCTKDRSKHNLFEAPPIDNVPTSRDQITERQMMIGVYNHIRNARYLGSITILKR